MLKQTAWQEPFIRMIRIWEDKVSPGKNVRATISWFYTSDLSVHGYMLEREGPSTDKPNLNRRIPAGVYTLYRHGHEGAGFQNVPGVDDGRGLKSRAILIQRGNRPDQREGCLLPGRNWLNHQPNNPNSVDGSTEEQEYAIMRFLTNTASSEDSKAYKIVNLENDLDAGRAQLILEENFQETTGKAKDLSLQLRRQII